MPYPLKPADIDQKYWNKFYNRWQPLFTSEHGGYHFTRRRNKVISGLFQIVAQQQVGGGLTFEVWCNNEEGTKWEFYQYVATEYGHPNGKISTNAKKIIYDQVAIWIEEDYVEVPELPEPVVPVPPIDDLINDGGGLLDGIIGTIKAWIQQAILAGLAFLDAPLKIINDLVSKLGQTISGIVEAVKSAISTVMAKVVGMFDIVVQKIKGVIDKVWENIQLVWEVLKDMFNTVKSAILIAFEKSWIFIKETFITLWTKMKEGLTYIGNAIVEGLKYLWDKIKDALNWTWEILKGAYTAIVETTSAIWNRTKNKLTETIESIKAAFGDFVDRIIEWWESYMEWRDKNTENLQNWTEEKIVDTIKFMLRAQKTVLEDLARER